MKMLSFLFFSTLLSILSAHADDMSNKLITLLPPDNKAEQSSPAEGLSIAQMGKVNGISIKNGQPQGGVHFTLPEKFVVTSAQLSLDVKLPQDYSGSTLELILNGQVLGTFLLENITDGRTHYKLNVPAVLMTSENNLSFILHNDRTNQCNYDGNDDSEIIILPTSYFSWDGEELNIEYDVTDFPEPFFDLGQMNPSSISFSFPASLSAETVNAAAFISSWLGIQASHRDVSFRALKNRLPDNNGIVFGFSGQKVGPLILPETSRPLIQIIPNPNSPVSKLLLIVGDSNRSLLAAMQKLVQGSQLNNKSVHQQKSQPYDAPRWLPTGQANPLLAHGVNSSVNGVWHDALSIAFRTSPDLYLPAGETIPLIVGYRFPYDDWIDVNKSTLNVTLNNKFLRSVPMMRPGTINSLWRFFGSEARQEKAEIQLDPYLIYGENQLSFYFNIVPKSTTPCQKIRSGNIKSSLTQTSFIDFTRVKHFAFLPNLSYFVGASFPFSRLADFSQTVLLLPSNPSETQLSTLFNLIARAGNSTGTPLNHNQVLLGLPENAKGWTLLHERDVLAVSSLEQESFMKDLLTASPFAINENTLGVREIPLHMQLFYWFYGKWNTGRVDANRYLSSVTDWRGLISYHSPWSNQRLVVMATASNDKQLDKLHADLRNEKVNAGIRGDVAIISDPGTVQSFQVTGQYPYGHLPFYMLVAWYTGQHNILLAFLTVIILVITGLLLKKLLRMHTAQRLNNPKRHDKEDRKDHRDDK